MKTSVRRKSGWLCLIQNIGQCRKLWKLCKNNHQTKTSVDISFVTAWNKERPEVLRKKEMSVNRKSFPFPEGRSTHRRFPMAGDLA